MCVSFPLLFNKISTDINLHARVDCVATLINVKTEVNKQPLPTQDVPIGPILNNIAAAHPSCHTFMFSTLHLIYATRCNTHLSTFNFLPDSQCICKQGRTSTAS